MRDGAINGSADIGDDPRTTRFLVMATLRREFGILHEEFARLSAEAVRYYLAYLEGLSDANKEKNQKT